MAFAFGGAERTTANLLQYLDRRCVQSITLVAPETLRSQLPPGYDHFVDAPRCGLHRGGFETYRALRADIKAMSTILRELQPDIALGMMHYSSALVVLGARGLGVKTVASYRGPFYEYMRHYERGLRRRLFLRTAISLTTRLADRIIVPSHGTQRELTRRFLGQATKTIVVPNGIDGEAARQAAQQTLPGLHDTQRPLICTAARLAPEKNLQLLLAAFRRVRETHSAYLLIVGDGPARPALEAAVAEWGLAESVSFAGHQDNVFPFLRHADLFIHTCQFEGFGYAMLEAMACGTPVIATDCPYGPREIIGEDQYGLLVPPDDAEALAAKIAYLLDNESVRRRFAARGLERAEELSIARMARGYEAALAGLMTETGWKQGPASLPKEGS